MIKQKGFTLIEMLVVIAIVGILSAVVLAALGPARNKAKDGRIVSSLNQIRVIAETLYDSTLGTYPSTVDSVSTSTSTITIANGNVNIDIEKLRKDITNQGGTPTINCTTVRQGCAFSSSLNLGGNYCIDTTGKTSNGKAANGVCP
jgi:prepilin-type N-terminal cleavage/methylation domain-containing protein